MPDHGSPPDRGTAADSVPLTDLELIQRYSLAVRSATAPRADVIEALRADLAWLEETAPARPARRPTAADAPAAKSATPAGKAAAPAKTAKAPRPPAKSTGTTAARPARGTARKAARADG